jgi:hypothetical protein
LHQSFVFYSVSFGSNNVERSMISNIESWRIHGTRT